MNPKSTGGEKGATKNANNNQSKTNVSNLKKEIKDLEEKNTTLTIENEAFKQNFNLKDCLKKLTQRGTTELDLTELYQENIIKVLQEAIAKKAPAKNDIEIDNKRLEDENKYLENILVTLHKLVTNGEGIGDSLQPPSEFPNNSAVVRSYEMAKDVQKQFMDMKGDKSNTTHPGVDNTNKDVKRIPEGLNESQDSAPKEKQANVNKELERLRAENDQLKNRLKESQDSAPKGNQANDNKELEQLRAENDQLKNRLKESQNSAPKEKQANDNKELDRLRAENDQLKNRLKENQDSAPKEKQANGNKELERLRTENDQLKNRLSEMAGAQMTFNNPNIADLSDEFRPTKLSEDYSQLYDNQWTDAFEEHGGRKEEDIIQMLRKSLLDCYEFCEKLCTQFTDQLKNATLALPNAEPRAQDIPIVYKKQLQDVKKSFGAFLRNDVKESYWKKRNTVEKGGKTKNYVDACVEISWLMVIQEPPVVMEAQASKDGVFDSEIFKTYTKTGKKVDFVVWPALRLHKGGPLLTKGVAQGKN